MQGDVTKSQVQEFYDEFKFHQQQLGVNIRHRTIYSNLKKAGLKPEHSVLEIGCGIGTVSSLILSKLKGKFVGVDISPESIGLAKRFNGGYKNAEFIVNDMTAFATETKFDFVVLPDVLEHIPVEQHAALFKTIASVASSQCVILINIPEPRTLDWQRKHHPEKMQIIDQSLDLGLLVTNACAAGFELVSLKPYCLHGINPDYVSIVFCQPRKPQPYVIKSWLARATDIIASRLV